MFTNSEPQQISFFNEISLMMFGFGDSHKPNPDTVRLVENITVGQLRLILNEASKYQTGTCMQDEELVFLMRKNKFKMRRFVKFLNNRDNSKSLKVVGQEVPKHKLIEFIEGLDETGELSDLTEHDEVKHERLVRADRISSQMDEENYLKFHRARCTSFRSKGLSHIRNFERLKQWIDPKNEIAITNGGLDVLSYYAYETVAQLTDYAMLVRLDHNKKSDPLGNLQGAHFTSSMFNGEHRLGGQNPDFFRVYSGQPPISVNEIREVMRRVSTPHSGKILLGKKRPTAPTILAL